MTANTIATFVIPLGCLAFVAWLIVVTRKKRSPTTPKTHGPHAPGPGYDKADVARSKGAGLGAGSDNSGLG